jgi:cysteine desulfurase/selenocysteine lyase
MLKVARLSKGAIGQDQLLDCKSDFPMLQKKMHGKTLVYLDSAATALKPQSVIDAMTDFYTHNYGTVHRAVYELAQHSTQEYSAVRRKVQTFLNAEKEEEIIFTKGTTESINLLAATYGRSQLQDGDEILISVMEHHSNIVPWQLAAEQYGAKIKVIPIDDNGDIILEEYHQLLSTKTKLVAIAHVSNALGTVNPIKELVAMAHAVGAHVFVDGAQAVPHMSVDVQDLDADFYAFSGHKAYGPTGVGILYGKYELLEKLPPYQGGGDMIETVSFEKTIYQPPPLRFEAGTPGIAQVLGLGAAIDYMLSLGMRNIQNHERQLLEYAEESIRDFPSLKIIGTAKEKGGIISFIIKDIHPLDIGTMLDFKGVAIRTGSHCAQPVMQRYKLSGTARASLAIYNTKEDIDAWKQALYEAVKILKA